VTGSRNCLQHAHWLNVSCRASYVQVALLTVHRSEAAPISNLMVVECRQSITSHLRNMRVGKSPLVTSLGMASQQPGDGASHAHESTVLSACCVLGDTRHLI
jgi:hypothetical protein